VRWDPCTPIHYFVNYDDAPDGASADVREAVARLADATGIAFVDDGTTDLTPEGDQRVDFVGAYERPNPVLIAWATPGRFRAWAPPRRADGVGMPWRIGGEGDRYVSGMIVLLASDRVRAGFDSRAELGPLLLHEWGHILGLAHVASGHELMWSPQVEGAEFPDLRQTSFGAGDREGLADVGRAAGCLAPSDPS
jgi:hypothetical protein